MKLGRIALFLMLVIASCSTPPEFTQWCYAFDFTTGANGFAVANGTIEPTGIVGNDLFISYTAPESGSFAYAQITIEAEQVAQVWASGQIFGLPVTINGEYLPAATPINLVFDYDGLVTDSNWSGSGGEILERLGDTVNVTLAATSNVTISRLEVGGSGSNPWGIDNCGSRPTETPSPGGPTPSLQPTQSPVPTETPEPTETPVPSETPTITPSASATQTEICTFYDFISSESGWEFFGTRGSYVSGQGWTPSYSNGGTSVATTFDLGASYRVTRIEANGSTNWWMSVGAGPGKLDQIDANNTWYLTNIGDGLQYPNANGRYITLASVGAGFTNSGNIQSVTVCVLPVNATSTPPPTRTPTITRTPTNTAQPGGGVTFVPSPTGTATRTRFPVGPTIVATAVSMSATPTVPVITLTPDIPWTVTPNQTQTSEAQGTATANSQATGTAIAMTGTPGATGTPGIGEGDLGGIGGLSSNIVGAGGNVINRAFDYLGQISATATGLFNAWFYAQPKPIAGLPNCEANPTLSQLCAIWWVLDNTIFAGTVGGLIIPLGVIVIDLVIVMRFLKMGKAIIVRLLKILDV